MAEKIKMRQVEEEYWKFTDTSGVGNATNQKAMINVQTPAIQQGTIANLPTEQKGVIEGWLGDLNGLMPRTKSTKLVDGTTQGPTKISRTSSKSSLSVQSDMSEGTAPESALVPAAQVPGAAEDREQENTFVQIVPK